MTTDVGRERNTDSFSNPNNQQPEAEDYALPTSPVIIRVSSDTDSNLETVELEIGEQSYRFMKSANNNPGFVLLKRCNKGDFALADEVDVEQVVWHLLMEIKRREIRFCVDCNEPDNPWKVRFDHVLDRALYFVMNNLIEHGLAIKGRHCDLLPKVDRSGSLMNTNLLVETDEENPPIEELLQLGSVLLELLSYGTPQSERRLTL